MIVGFVADEDGITPRLHERTATKLLRSVQYSKASCATMALASVQILDLQTTEGPGRTAKDWTAYTREAVQALVVWEHFRDSTLAPDP